MLCLTLIGLGLTVSGYLLAHTFTLLEYYAPDAIDLCSAVFGAGCDKALLSSTSWQFRIPLAGWGVVYYVTLASLLVLAWALGEAFELEATLAALVLAAAGASASVALTAVVVAGWAPFCPLCMAVHAINLLLPVSLKRLSGCTLGQVLQGLRAGGKYLLGGQAEAPAEARWKVVGFVTAALVSIVLYQWVLVESELRLGTTGGPLDPEQLRASYASTPKQEVPVGADDPCLGGRDLPVRLVVFSSFQCPGCQKFALDMHKLADQFRGKLAIFYKHYPLGTACNGNLTVDQYPRACEAACAAEAARRQGKFWPFHDALFSSRLGGDEQAIQRIAGEQGLDLGRFQADWRSQATMAKVKSDIALGGRLGVDGTPAVFLNERPVRRISRRALEVLIEQELGSAQL